MSRWRFLRRAAFTAAVGGVLYAATTGETSEPLRPSPSTADPTGHLALVRAHPGLRELNALLTPSAFLIDATQALLAGALRVVPYHCAALRQGRDFLSARITSAESEGNADQEAWDRLSLALLDARDGRLEDALDACARLAAERPGKTIARIYAAALCHMLGRPEEGARWLGHVSDLSNLEDKVQFMEAVATATLGCAPHAVDGTEKLVAVTALGLVEITMWSMFKDADLPDRLQVLALMAFLRRAVVKNLRKRKDHALEGSDDATPT